MQFQPLTPEFNGNVYVLLSKKTASAAEMAAQALSGLDQVTLIGETTAGTMLSQKMYDIDGFHLFLPIADYYTICGQRIEGTGVAPDITIDAKLAMEKALALAD